jgi:hypothetical protein
MSDAEVTALVGDAPPLPASEPGTERVGGADPRTAFEHDRAEVAFTALLRAHAAGDALGTTTASSVATELPSEGTSVPVSSPGAEEPSSPPAGVEDADQPEALPFAMADTVTLDPMLTRGLSRDFVGRLRRVAERMWNEHGLHVEVVEGYRTQGRQDALFTQGRSAPGPVVTWTRSSLHTDGLAADLNIGGAPVTPRDALVLAQIAREEGLSTLYPLDSGHIQLDVPGADVGPEGPLGRRAPSRPGPSPAAPPRGVAPVAPVAPVAKPARAPGTVSSDLGTPAPAPSVPVDAGVETRPGSGLVATAPAAVAARLSDDDLGQREREGFPTKLERAVDAPVTDRNAHPVSDRYAARPGSGAAQGAAKKALREETGRPLEQEAVRPGSDPARASSATSAESASAPRPQLVVPHDMSGSAPGRPAGPAAPQSTSVAGGAVDPSRFEVLENAPYYQRLHIPIDGLDGSSLSVGLSGTAVNAKLNLSDPVLAGELRGRMHELRHQLAQQGVESGELAVRVVSETPADTSARPAAGSEPRTFSQGASGGSTSDAGSQQGRSTRSRDPQDDRERGTSRQRDPYEEGKA